ncbi:YheC/YheD family protein [Staphylospora marina]|uniref:YheC/YheD family endospore coat-associated protein n=1 Tax=Staphylospora marina TaxID=2490858 RepID=UPI000F5BBF8F|nr:YheC/YheD family protein [Staphylospora marina]
MGQARVQIQILPDHVFPEGTQLIMSRSLASILNIRSNPFLITFGAASSVARIAASRSGGNLIRVSSTLAAKLNMHSVPKIHARFDPRTFRLRIGPLLGILINPQPDATEELPFGAMTKFMEECIFAGHGAGLQVFVFSPDSLDLERKSVQGWIRNKDRWISVRLPLPDVVYNRLTSRKVEQQESVQTMLSRMKRIYHIPVFNEQFLNKIEVYDILVKDEQIRRMLPETCRFHPKSVKEMLLRHPILYLKPNNGSLGSGICRVSRGSGKWICQSASQSGIITRETKTLTEMVHILRRRVGKQDYLLQQGLQLAKYDNRQVDFRVLVQKDGKGEWKITSAVARIANDSDIVSNLARGATIRKASEVLPLLGAARKPALNEIRRIAVDIATTFERIAGGHYAELGIDLAVDIHGNVWLIEINSKPSKTDDTVLNPSLSTRPSVRRLLEYVLFLCGMVTRNHSPPRSPKRPTKAQRRRPT